MSTLAYIEKATTVNTYTVVTLTSTIGLRFDGVTSHDHWTTYVTTELLHYSLNK